MSVEVQRCRRCLLEHPLGEFDKAGHSRAGVIHYRRVCKPCRREEHRERYRSKVAGAESLAALRAQWRASKERASSTETGRERVRQLQREYRARKMADPVKREEHNRRVREQRARLKAEDPEAYAKMRAQEEERRRRRLDDPAAYRRHVEMRRMSAALVRDRQGVLGKGTPRGEVLSEQMGGLPVGPLLKAIEEWLGDRSYEAVDAFLASRNLRDWRTGRVSSAHFDVADRVLVGIDRLWWEVWSEDQPGHEKAAELFTGEKAAA